MSGSFPLTVNDVAIRTSKAIYQACRLPHLPTVQREIISQASPIAAKMTSRAHHGESRPDLMALRVANMWWSLRVKLTCNPATFGCLLLSTDGLAIVERSTRDGFWGAIASKEGDEIPAGRNVLGRLLGLLRGLLREHGADRLSTVPRPPIPDFLLYGVAIGDVTEPGIST